MNFNKTNPTHRIADRLRIQNAGETPKQSAKPNRNKAGDAVMVCIECINVDIEPGQSPCTAAECEVCATTSGTLQYLSNLKVEV